MHLTEPKSATPHVPLTRAELDHLDARARAGEKLREMREDDHAQHDPDYWDAVEAGARQILTRNKGAKQP